LIGEEFGGRASDSIGDGDIRAELVVPAMEVLREGPKRWFSVRQEGEASARLAI
jgi:hypothetical protein